MTDRDREIVESYKGMISIPHLRVLDGQWFMFDHEGDSSFIDYVDENGSIGGDYSNTLSYFVNVLGYTVTPLIIYKVDTRYSR